MVAREQDEYHDDDAVVNSLSATGAFTLRDGGHGCGVWTHSTATWDDGRFHGEAGTLDGMAPDCVARLADRRACGTATFQNAGDVAKCGGDGVVISDADVDFFDIDPFVARIGS